MDNGLLNPFEEKTLDLRIGAARSAQERTRLAFFASTVISLAIITAGWNAYFSFYKDFAFEFPSLEGGSGTVNLQKELLFGVGKEQHDQHLAARDSGRNR